MGDYRYLDRKRVNIFLYGNNIAVVQFVVTPSVPLRMHYVTLVPLKGRQFFKIVKRANKQTKRHCPSLRGTSGGTKERSDGAGGGNCYEAFGTIPILLPFLYPSDDMFVPTNYFIFPTNFTNGHELYMLACDDG